MKKSEIDYTASVAKLDKRVAVPKYYFDELPKQLREMAFTVSNLETLRQIQMVKRSLENAIDDGFSFESWKETLPEEIFDKLSDARLETVYRTNLGIVYGQSTRFNAITSNVTPYLMYSATGDDRTRESHQKLDGIVKRADSKFWDKYMPSWGYNCRCDAIPMTEAMAKSVGIDKNTPTVDDDGFGTRAMGDMMGSLEKDTNDAISALPKNSPYRAKFIEAQTNNKSLVDIWFQKNKAIFEQSE